MGKNELAFSHTFNLHAGTKLRARAVAAFLAQEQDFMGIDFTVTDGTEKRALVGTARTNMMQILKSGIDVDHEQLPLLSTGGVNIGELTFSLATLPMLRELEKVRIVSPSSCTRGVTGHRGESHSNKGPDFFTLLDSLALA